MLDLDPFEALALSLHHSPGSLALLVGSGLSRAAGIPTGWEITLDLVRRYAAVKGAESEDDVVAWYRKEAGREPNYSELLDALASTQSERRDILHRYLEPQADDDKARRPTKAHHAIARLVADGRVRVLVTTNFDRLLENALRDAGVEPTVIAHEDALAGAVPIVHARCTVIKVHGDYLDSRIKNTDVELETYSPAMDALLDEVFDRFGLVAVGWSGEWDAALRSAILRAPSRRYPFYWAARGDPAELATDLIDQRQGRSFQITDADSFLTRLDSTLQALAAAGRPHPTSAAMAVALAKRYCRDDAFALEWTELLAAEATKIRRFVTDPDFHPPGTPTAETLNDLVRRFLGQCEILRRVCLVAGRWGTQEAAKSVIRVLRELQFRDLSGGGFTYFVALRALGASFCFYWFLVGCAAGERWTLALEVMRARIRYDDKDKPFVALLPLTSYETVEWKILEGFENKRTPASDFMFERLKAEISDIAVSATGLEDLFDEVELLVAIEAAYQHIRVRGMDWFWTPYGRFTWRERSKGFESILAEGAEYPWVKAGLADGTVDTVKSTIAAVRELFSKFPRY